MKAFVRFLSVFVIVAVVAGCASDTVYVPRIPAAAQAKLLDYFEQPDNKVFIIAIDPSGEYTFGYDYGKPTLKAAAKVAIEKCDASRKSRGVVAPPYIYALNDKVVYEEMIRKAHQGSVEGEREAQTEEVEAEDAEVNPEVAEEQLSEATADEQ